MSGSARTRRPGPNPAGHSSEAGRELGRQAAIVQRVRRPADGEGATTALDRVRFVSAESDLGWMLGRLLLQLIAVLMLDRLLVTQSRQGLELWVRTITLQEVQTVWNAPFHHLKRAVLIFITVR
ncbi:hypothetical protein MHYP_G00194740 [Metynnis hypsauchen]